MLNAILLVVPGSPRAFAGNLVGSRFQITGSSCLESPTTVSL